MCLLVVAGDSMVPNGRYGCFRDGNFLGVLLLLSDRRKLLYLKSFSGVVNCYFLCKGEFQSVWGGGASLQWDCLRGCAVVTITSTRDSRGLAFLLHGSPTAHPLSCTTTITLSEGMRIGSWGVMIRGCVSCWKGYIVFVSLEPYLMGRLRLVVSWTACYTA